MIIRDENYFTDKYELTRTHSEVLEAVKVVKPGKTLDLGCESGPEARVCDYAWVLSLRDQCAEHDVSFCFHQTGARLLKDGRLYRIRRQFQHMQARKAGIDFKAGG